MDIPDLIPDVVGVIFGLMDGETRYRMSMVTRGWNSVCMKRVMLIYTTRDLILASERGDALTLIASYENFHRDKFMKYLAKSGLSITHAFVKRTNKLCHAMIGACSNDRIDIVRSLIPICSIFEFESGLRYACKYEHMELVKLLIPFCREFGLGFVGACESGNIKLLNKIQRRRPESYVVYTHKFIHANKTALYKEVIKFLNLSVFDDPNTLPAACYSGDTDLVQYLMSLGYDNWNRGLKFAARGGKLGTARMMIAKGATNISKAMIIACSCGFVDIVTEILTLDVLSNETLNSMFCNSMFSPDMNVAKLILGVIGSLLPDYVNLASTHAAMSGNPIAIRYMLELGARNYDSMIFHCISHGFPNNASIVIDAFEHRNHDIIRHEYDLYYTNSNVVGIDYTKILTSCCKSSLFTALGVQILISYGAVPDITHLNGAILQGNNEVIECLSELMDVRPIDLLSDAIHYHNMRLIDTLLKKGVVPTPAMLKKAAEYTLDYRMYGMLLRAYKKSS